MRKASFRSLGRVCCLIFVMTTLAGCEEKPLRDVVSENIPISKEDHLRLEFMGIDKPAVKENWSEEEKRELWDILAGMEPAEAPEGGAVYGTDPILIASNDSRRIAVVFSGYYTSVSVDGGEKKWYVCEGEDYEAICGFRPADE